MLATTHHKAIHIEYFAPKEHVHVCLDFKIRKMMENVGYWVELT